MHKQISRSPVGEGAADIRSSRVTSDDARFDLQLQEQEWCGRAEGVASGERALLNAQDDTISYYRMRP